ncbi:jg14768 [Pararge aegeria aegeria]|uniref:Jg14768 protein n=1 Tax=Pararge aegeria aegeria TaxID=348720 RepID=A0A8S4SF52_9NEOP|nr:jg14768 [Pararge aegeria aegeria]
MFFDDEDEGYHNPGVFHIVRQELYAITTNLTVTPFGLRTIPTHTEDGIPIRKLYVSNLPPKTTRTELFGVFAQYGFIKSCWLRMGDKGPNRIPTPTYAFVTFSNPADAHKALQAPLHEKTLRGRSLKISPADSWHQPSEDPDGSINWKPLQSRREDEGSSTPSWDRGQQDSNNAGELSESVEAENSVNANEEANKDVDDDLNQPYNMLDILNNDCLSHILTYVPIRDLIRSERVSKSWQNMVQEYLQSIRMFKTSWWQHVPVTLTTAVLRRVLLRLGNSLLRLHIDHHWSALNDRTAHTVGKFCPNLEELKVVGMHTKNWNPLIYGCKNLKTLSFVSCNKLTDSSLVHLVKKDSCIESLTVANNTHVTGLFLTGSNPPKLSSLEFYNCYSLQGTVLSAALDSLPSLTTLKLDVCPVTMWKMIPLILSKLTKLQELSLSEYTSVELCLTPMGNEAFCKSLACLTELKILNISRNIYITNAVLKTVAQSCSKLESLNISSCNSRKSFQHPGVGDEGLTAVCTGCSSLTSLDVSYLAALSDSGLSSVTRLSRLVSLTARGNPTLSASPFSAVLASCHLLEEIDACGCDNLGGEVIVAANDALRTRPRPITLCLAATAAALIDGPQLNWRTPTVPEYDTHKFLTLNLCEDRSNPHLRADFVDRLYDESSEGSFDDIYDHEDFDDFLAGVAFTSYMHKRTANIAPITRL